MPISDEQQMLIPSPEAASASDTPNPEQGRGAAISIAGVSKTYYSKAGSVEALSSTDLEIKAGEFVVLLGPSGCGKTTLLRMLGGLHAPTTGSITIGSTPLFSEGQQEPDRDALGSLGFVFQHANLMPWRRIWQNIALPLEVLKINRQKRREKAQQMAEMVGLGDFVSHYPRQLSGGMQQRVAIARALIHEPSILLMDEPFGALDAMTRDQMNEQLQQLWLDTGKTVVLVTHSINEAVFLADRIILLSARPGRIADRIEVNLPRPRTRSIAADARFADLVVRLREQLGT